MSSPKGFLTTLAQKCKDQYGDQCDRLTVVFPNKRAGVYFAQALASLYDKPVWSPKICSLEEYIIGQQDLEIWDELQLNLLLYSVYQPLIKQSESFDAFFPWGEMILKDFNDIDNYLVDPDHIFRIVSSQKELDESFAFLSERDQKIIQQFWRGFLPVPNKKQAEFIQTWQILKPLYDTFHQKLKDKSATYKGHAFKLYADGEQTDEHVWFAGFNALTKAEEKIIKRYLSLESNDIFWDVDAYYLNSEVQEAGEFFRQYVDDPILGKSIKRDTVDHFNIEDKTIKVVAAPFGTGQVMSATQSLTDRYDKGQLSNTLLVVTDEALLPPLMDCLPQMEVPVNITAGWSLGRSRVFLLVDQLLRLKLDSGKSKYLHIDSINQTLQYADLLKLSHEEVRRFQKESVEDNRFYHSMEQLSELFDPVKEVFVGEKNDVIQLLSTLMAVVKSLTPDELSDLDQAARQSVYRILKQVKTALEESQIKLELVSLQKLIAKLGGVTKLPLIGDTKNPVQVMGVLETRNLSFENVYIIGMNEGAWPSDSSNSSFIPYNIRKAFELPVVEHGDAMQSYLFYRLLQDANHIEIYYNNISEFNYNGELSRYVRQLQHESALRIDEELVINQIDAKSPKEIVGVKDEAAMEALSVYTVERGSKSLSPSALNTYLECPLRFYYRYAKKLYEPDEIKEDIDPALLGNLLHAAMEYLYKGRVEMTEDDFDSLDIDSALEDSFIENKLSLKDEAKVLGRQQVVYEVLKKYMLEIIDYDRQHAPFKILGLERKDWKVAIPLDGGQDLDVNLGGIIDRVDEYNDRVRILDYKSGKDGREYTGIDALFDPEDDKRNKAVFQLYYYCLLYLENNTVASPIQIGLFNSSDLFKDDFAVDITENIAGRKPARQVVYDAKEHIDDYKLQLTQLVNEIYDTSIDFVQTTDDKKCSYCPYSSLCFKG